MAVDRAEGAAGAAGEEAFRAAMADDGAITEAPKEEEAPIEEKKGGASRFYPIYSLRWFLSVFDPYLPDRWTHRNIAEWHTGVKIPPAEARFAFECSKVGVPENIRNTIYWLTFPPLLRIFFPGLNWWLFKWFCALCLFSDPRDALRSRFMILRWGPTFVPFAIEQMAVAPMRLLVYFMGGLAGPNTWKRL